MCRSRVAQLTPVAHGEEQHKKVRYNGPDPRAPSPLPSTRCFQRAHSVWPMLVYSSPQDHRQTPAGRPRLISFSRHSHRQRVQPDAQHTPDHHGRPRRDQSCLKVSLKAPRPTPDRTDAVSVGTCSQRRPPTHQTHLVNKSLTNAYMNFKLFTVRD